MALEQGQCSYSWNVKTKPVDRLVREMPYLKKLIISTVDVNYKEVGKKDQY
jgi:hypothetical protein